MSANHLPNQNKKSEKITPKETQIEDLNNFDANNVKYTIFIDNILDHIQNGRKYSNDEQYGTTLPEIARCCAITCREFYLHKKTKIIPRKVQVLAVLRLVDEVLNGKSEGVISEIKTGEGKSLIITIVSIILVYFYNRTVDIVTSNMQLAKRDQVEQFKYFKLFNIQTGVLLHKESDKEYLDYCLTFADNNKVEHNYNTDVFEFPVVYSTNHNFEFVYLF